MSGPASTATKLAPSTIFSVSTHPRSEIEDALPQQRSEQFE
jgi:hypothetical protein